MAKIQRNFIQGRMNKSVDERLVPNGEYVDGLNVRLGSTEASEIGSVENAKGNERLTTLQFNGTNLSNNAKCIGALEDGIHETMYWFVHDPNFSVGATGKLDMIVSYNVNNGVLTYHVISIDDGGGVNTTLNFDSDYLITGVNIVDDLLFFTDDLNPPRNINVTRNYPNPVSNIDEITAEQLMVIKKPPVTSPAIAPSTNTSEDNFLEDRFICFAYRYKYADNEYSATSQFSEPAFLPKNFLFDTSSYLNSGMENFANECVITYNSGGPLVVGIDLLFKDMDDPIIKIIESLDKADLGLANDTDYTYTFTNSKIYTILDDAEIIRLYDNVPHTAKAQTIMGNRLMYGNYTDGYDLVDENDIPVKFEYTTNLITDDIGENDLTTTLDDGDYSFGSTITVTDSIAEFDLTGQDLVTGATLSFEIRFEHDSFAGDTPFPTEETSAIDIQFDYILQRDFNSVYELATDDDFVRKIGTINLTSSGSNTSVIANKLIDSSATFIADGTTVNSLVTNESTNESTIVTSVDSETQLTLSDDIFTATPENYAVYSSTSIRSVEDSCSGSTFTDEFNCNVPNNLDSLIKVQSGINNANEPISIVTSPSSDIIGLQIPAMKFVDSLTSPTQTVYEYYTITFTSAEYREIGNPTSLHSNRDYEVGMIYMDEFNRATTALVSPNNTVHVPCSNSDTRNQIQVTIPTQQKPPEWATRYKFCIKPDKDTYETIYTNIFYEDVTSNSVYFLLEGENAAKVNEGDTYFVKSDTQGPLNNCVTATVLEKDTKAPDFLSPAPQDSDDNDIPVLGGVYMKMKPRNFSAVFSEDSTIAYGTFSDQEKDKGSYPRMAYTVNLKKDGGEYYDYDVPANSRIKIEIYAERIGKNCGTSAVERRYWASTVNMIASNDYDNFKEWWDGDNAIGALEAAAISDVDCGECEQGVIYNSSINTTGLNSISQTFCDLNLQFLRYSPVGSDDGRLALGFVGIQSGGTSNKKRSRIRMNIEVVRAESTLVFETKPRESLPDTWYESSDSFPITSGFHEGNTQDQTASQPAIVLTDFYNCISFGNGVESYKIKDSITGRKLELGNRVFTTSSQEYKRANRDSDITYSGVFNDESNINKLNSFNLGQLNFKVLEDSFGPIQRLVGRETDVLTFQEDKISYVLQGKNLLSDSSAGGSITSVPEVLGTQIARIENFGMSHNPESYAEWGSKKYFTDAKRGAVLELNGSNYQNEQLMVISEFGMRSWYRDLFIDSFNTHKLGAFDPYMNEYVLSSNDIELPVEEECIDCGVTRTYNITAGTDTTYCVNVGELVGDVTISYNIQSVSSTINIDATYDGTTTSSGNVSTSGSFTFDKDVVGQDEANIEISAATGTAVVEVTVSCPDAQEITIVLIGVTSQAEAGQFIHNEYRWTDGVYISPLHSMQMDFLSGNANPLVSMYETVTGPQGAGIIPADSAVVSIISNKIEPQDNFEFNSSVDKFYYHRSNTLYNNTVSEISTLLGLATEATPITGGPNTFEATFNMPDTDEQYLYLIYDYRNGEQEELCFGTSPKDVCCQCEDEDEEEEFV